MGDKCGDIVLMPLVIYRGVTVGAFNQLIVGQVIARGAFRLCDVKRRDGARKFFAQFGDGYTGIHEGVKGDNFLHKLTLGEVYPPPRNEKRLKSRCKAPLMV